MIQAGDIVKFISPSEHVALQFCHLRSISGKVIGEEMGKLKIDAGLGYPIYSEPDCLGIVAKSNEIPVPE